MKKKEITLYCNNCYAEKLKVHEYNGILYVDPCSCQIDERDELLKENEISYQNGFNDGHDEGYNEGYDLGYKEGLTDKEEKANNKTKTD